MRVVELIHIVGGVLVVGIGIHERTSTALRRRASVRRRLPAKAAHVRATTSATGTGVVLNTRLQGGRGVAGWMRRRSDGVVASRSRRSRTADMDITSNVGRKRAVRDILLEILPLKTSTIELGAGRHRYISMPGGGSCDW